jgi:predicted nucleotidyltransferase
MKAGFRTKNHPLKARLKRGRARPPAESRAPFAPPRVFDGVIPHERIQAYCEAVAREFRPRKIILFGSYAYGQPTADSDVDLLVIMPFHGSDVSKAMQIRARFDTPFPMDLIVRKPEFIAQRQRERDMFIELVMGQGQVMYESQHA